MSLPRFFAENLQPGNVTLDERESRHLLHARRLRSGDAVVLFNGRGDEGAGSVLPRSGHAGRVEIAVSQVTHRPRPRPLLTLAVALPKGARQDWLIEKCTELGVAVIQPLTSQRSIAEASPHRLSKWRQATIEAAKQSGQAWLPEIQPTRAVTDLLQAPPAVEAMYIATAGAPMRAAQVTWPATVMVLIGPEGDWAPEELDLAQRAGAIGLGLGPNILRVETAAIVVAGLVHAAAG